MTADEARTLGRALDELDAARVHLNNALAWGDERDKRDVQAAAGDRYVKARRGVDMALGGSYAGLDDPAFAGSEVHDTSQPVAATGDTSSGVPSEEAKRQGEAEVAQAEGATTVAGPGVTPPASAA